MFKSAAGLAGPRFTVRSKFPVCGLILELIIDGLPKASDVARMPRCRQRTSSAPFASPVPLPVNTPPVMVIRFAIVTRLAVVILETVPPLLMTSDCLPFAVKPSTSAAFKARVAPALTMMFGVPPSSPAAPTPFAQLEDAGVDDRVAGVLVAEGVFRLHDQPSRPVLDQAHRGSAVIRDIDAKFGVAQAGVWGVDEQFTAGQTRGQRAGAVLHPEVGLLKNDAAAADRESAAVEVDIRTFDQGIGRDAAAAGKGDGGLRRPVVGAGRNGG